MIRRAIFGRLWIYLDLTNQPIWCGQWRRIAFARPRLAPLLGCGHGFITKSSSSIWPARPQVHFAFQRHIGYFLTVLESEIMPVM